MGGDQRLSQQRTQLDALLDLASVLDEWLKRRAAEDLLDQTHFSSSSSFGSGRRQQPSAEQPAV